MTEQHLALLIETRQVLDRYLFDDDGQSRDDVVSVCMKLDDVLGPNAEVTAISTARKDRAVA